MPRPTKKIEIPYHPIKSISELLEEGKTHKEISEYFDVGRSTITERIKKAKNAECRKIIKDRMEREE